MSLVELMCALAFLVLLSGAVSGFFFQMSRQRERLAAVSAGQRDTALLTDRLETALMHAVAVGPGGEAGVRGDAASLSVVTRAVWPMLAGAAGLDDTCEVGLRLDEVRGRCVMTVTPLGAGGEAVEQPVLSGVERMRFRYSDGRRWSASFDSLEAGGLPVGVEVSVWLRRGGETGDGDEPSDRTGAEAFELGPGAPLNPALFGEDWEFGSASVPEEEESWTPREPDLVRMVTIPDAPDWRERGP
jgi:hypothetical protein